MKRKVGSLLVLILVVGIVLLVMRWNDYREKDLVDVLNGEEIEQFIYLEPNTETAVHFQQTAFEDPETIKEVVDFLGQYKVKKEEESNFSTRYPDEQFHFMLKYTDERITVPSMIERDVLLFHNNQYTITNGPVDYSWIEAFLAKQKQ
ncbi:hypothetical protein [Planococcus sp. CAU13]|uniref:hypothetical protein n=1 Tax=Planococcus sp. CAU13 TaxID=1541197 RepID=UPI00052FFC04|nr:hypothetical protein [Planococcus sp. CAU13]